MKDWHVYYAVVMFALILGAIVLWVYPQVLAEPVVYEGKEVFRTVQEYSAFKEEIGKEEVTIEDIEVLSSEPPIVVSWRVEVPVGYNFPYGTAPTGTNHIGAAWFSSILLTLVASALIIGLPIAISWVF